MTDPIVQAAAEVLRLARGSLQRVPITSDHSEWNRHYAEAVVAAVTPLIRAQIADEIEECIDWSPGRYTYGDNDGYQHSARIARGDKQ